MAALIPALSGCGGRSPEARLEKALIALQTQQYVDAYLEFQRFIQDYPDHPDAPLVERQLGDCLFHQGLFDQAVERYQIVIDRYPGNREATLAAFGQATAYQQIGNVTRAFETVLPIYNAALDATMTLSDTPLRAYAARFLGNASMMRGDTEAALAYYQEFGVGSTKLEDKLAAGESAARALLARDDLKGAAAIFRQLADANSTPAQRRDFYRLSVARIHHELTEYQAAIAIYDEILSATTLGVRDRGQALMEKSDSLVRDGQFEAACAIVEGIIADPTMRMDESVPHLKLRLAEIRSMAGERDRAAEVYRELRSSHPKSWPALWGHVLESDLYRADAPAQAESVFLEAVHGLREIASATATLQDLEESAGAYSNIYFAYIDHAADREKAIEALHAGMSALNPSAVRFTDPYEQQRYVHIARRFHNFADEQMRRLTQESDQALDAAAAHPDIEGGGS